MYAPRRYSASIPAGNARFFRMSATRKALRIVPSMAAGALLDDLAGAACGLDAVAGGLGGRGCVPRELLRQLAAREDLDRVVLAGAEAGGAQGAEVDRDGVVEPRLEVLEVD